MRKELIQNETFDKYFLEPWCDIKNFTLLEQEDGSSIGVVARRDTHKLYEAALEMSKYCESLKNELENSLSK